MILKDRIKFIENEKELRFLNVTSKTSRNIWGAFLFNQFMAEKECDLSAILFALREGYDVVYKRDRELIGNYTVSADYDFYKTREALAA